VAQSRQVTHGCCCWSVVGWPCSLRAADLALMGPEPLQWGSFLTLGSGRATVAEPDGGDVTVGVCGWQGCPANGQGGVQSSYGFGAGRPP
jgi:hypothetical protein